MKFPLLATVFAATGFSAPMLFANTYQTEIKMNYLEFDAKNSDIDSSITNFEAARYFSPVDTTNLPYAEAAFLNKANSFVLGYMDSENDAPYGAVDSKGRWAEINYYVPDTLFFLGAGIRQYKTHYVSTYYLPEYDGYYEYDYETDWNSTWVGRVGITPIDGLLIWSDFHEHQKLSDNWNLHAKYVKPLANNKAIGIESYFDNYNKYDRRELSVVADYYFNQAFSVGAGVFHYEYEHDDDSTVALIRSRYFLTDKLGIDLTYTDGENVDTWKIGGSVRF